jgi:hypothetical protein
MCGKAVRMSPRQQSTSRKHAEGNADYAVEQRPPLAISTEISPAKQQHQAKVRIFSPVNSGGEPHLRARQSASRGLLSTVTTLPQTASFKGWWAMRNQNCKSFPLRHHLRGGPRSQPQLSYKVCGGKATTFPERKALPAERQHPAPGAEQYLSCSRVGKRTAILVRCREDITQRKNGRGVARK